MKTPKRKVSLASPKSDGVLGQIGAPAFLARHWQKRPLLIRQAIAEFSGVVDRTGLFRLAGRAAVESRLVQRKNGRWSLLHGPLTAAHLRRMPVRDWTLLVQGVNQHLPAADRLLRRFSFIPHARLDDLMVSYAAPGGGVGPHVDSYDVFLLQAQGSRVWRIARPRKGRVPRLVEGVPLKILRDFSPDEEYLLEPGDMLYLPPGWAHDGTALEPGMTCSIGFRAPAHQELVTEFLVRHAEQLNIPGLYADPGLKRQRHPAQLPPGLIAETRRLLSRLRFTQSDVATFLGQYLSEPKANIVFDAPRRPMSKRHFSEQARRAGVDLDPRTLMLSEGRHVYVNGERTVPATLALEDLRTLADQRALGPGLYASAVHDQLYSWYVAGWLNLAKST